MGSPQKPAVYTIPPHRAFADALVTGILDQHGGDPLTLARGAILVPNNRAVQAVRDAFVRQCEGGLLLPRLIPIGDEDLDARLGAALDPMDNEPTPPAIDPLHRQLILAQLIQTERALARSPVDAAEAMRLAADLARTLDQLIVEGVDPRALETLDMAGALSAHWQGSLDQLMVILNQWPAELERRGMIDLTTRRNLLLGRLAKRWSELPPSGFVIAAGISTVAPAVADVLRVIARIPQGQVVLAGLDTHMDEMDWDEIGGSDERAPVETHPQFHLALLLNRMKIKRGEVMLWRRASEHDAAPQRSRALSHAMALPEATKEWHELATSELRLPQVFALEASSPAQEAQAIALALREALEVGGQTAALVTPDRDLARRVVALLARWGILADDSAGQPLSGTSAGGLILALVEVLVSDFAPVPLLSLLKHPLVMTVDERLIWLDGVRRLDLALRGPRPAAGLAGINAFLASGDDRSEKVRAKARDWWRGVEGLFTAFDGVTLTLPSLIAALRETLDRLSGDALWAGASGHAAAELFTQLEVLGREGPNDLSLKALAPLLRQLMDAISVRPSGALHPRISIWGLLEAKLQTADVMILGGLNEGIWPALPTPDPWLAPRIRHMLGLPTLERRIGLSAHDLVGAMGAKKVLLTRAMRDARSATIASRFWLRIEALTGGLPTPDVDYTALAVALDRPPHAPNLSKRPAPLVATQHRPKTIHITEVDTLNADPYAFYARAILRLNVLDPVDAEPSDAWRGSLIHSALHNWAVQDKYQPDKVVGQFRAAFASANLHPLLRRLWLPRFTEAAEWIAQQTAEARAEGRVPVGAEVKGSLEIGGVTLIGRLDRVDKLADGSLAIIDYKSGKPPSAQSVAEGFYLQLPLIGIVAMRGGFGGVVGAPSCFEYWSLGRDKSNPYGYMKSALGKVEPTKFLTTAEAQFQAAIDRWLMGNDPFTAKRAPERAYSEYNHLMRYDEWAGRDG